MRVAEERCMRWAETSVQAQRELVTEQRRRRNARQVSKIPGKSRTDHASLFVPLPIAEEKCSIATNRTANLKPGLSPLEEWIRDEGIALENRIRGQRVIAEEIKQRAVEI